MKQFLSLALLVTSAVAAPIAPPAEPAQGRPHLVALAHVAFLAHDLGPTRQFYESFLGFDETWTFQNPDGTPRVLFVKINDRQSLELRQETAVGTDRLFQVALETDNAEAMRQSLQAKGVAVPAQTTLSKTGDAIFTVLDPDGQTVEFIQHLPGGRVAQDQGKHLPDTRIALRMSHCGIMVRHLDAALHFYRDVLGCVETWRGSKDKRVLSWVNLRLPDSRDYLELMLYDQAPPTVRIRSMHHICLEVADVAQAQGTLASRSAPPECPPPGKIALGVNGKRQINYFDPDGTRVEVMEPNPASGVPVPPSPAPPPGD